MAEITPRDLLACIRYEFQLGHPFCEALENFCKVFGNDAITLGHFEFWWYRFKEGNFHLDYKGPRKAELSDIPLDIVEEIIENLEWKERCLFRKVSKKCRKVVDSVPYTFNKVEFYDGTKYAYLHIDDNHIDYDNRANDNYSPFAIETKSKALMKRAFTDFTCILKNPKNQIKTLFICARFNSIRNDFNRFLPSLPHQIHVERLEFRGADDYKTSSGNEELLNILPYLKPGILTDIDQYTHESFLRTDELAELDQWKQAKSFETNTKIPKNFEHIKHFHRLNVHFEYIWVEDLIQLTNIFSSSPNFQYARIDCNGSEPNAMKTLRANGFNFKNISIEDRFCSFTFSKKN